MKKTLVAVSVLGAFAGSALAADVQLYGILDTGVGYSHIDMDTSGVDDVDSFEMKSGVVARHSRPGGVTQSIFLFGCFRCKGVEKTA